MPSALATCVWVWLLMALSGNPQFPQPVSNDGQGNILWDSGAISTVRGVAVGGVGARVEDQHRPADVRFQPCVGEQSGRVLSANRNRSAVGPVRKKGAA
jgi:hypothetical protein